MGAASNKRPRKPLDIAPRLRTRLVCPACRAELEDRPGALACRACRRRFPVVEGVPELVLPEAFGEAEREAIAEWDRLSADYARLIADVGPARLRPIDLPLLRTARGDVLEVGCGDGRLLERLPRRSVTSVVGVDWSRGMARQAHGRGVPAIVAAAERLPFASESFDAVMSGYYALRSSNLALALPEIARVLRPDGRFAFTFLARPAVVRATRLGALRELTLPGSRRQALRTLVGPEDASAAPNDVASAAALTARLAQDGLAARVVLGTPYLPGVGPWLLRLLRGRLPYLRGEGAVRFGFDIIVLGVKGQGV